MAIGYKQREDKMDIPGRDPFGYLVDLQNEEQENIFNPPNTGPSLQKVQGPKISKKGPTGQQPGPGQLPQTYNPTMQPLRNPQVPSSPVGGETNMPTTYTDPLTGEDTGMSYDMFVQDWNNTSTANYFDSYEAYLEYMQNQTPGFDPIWSERALDSFAGVGDFNGDGVIDNQDLAYVWGQGSAGNWSGNMFGTDDPNEYVQGGIGGGEGLAPGQGVGSMQIGSDLVDPGEESEGVIPYGWRGGMWGPGGP